MLSLLGDAPCKAIGGICRIKGTDTCHGAYQSGLCDGPPERPCCVPGIVCIVI